MCVEEFGCAGFLVWFGGSGVGFFFVSFDGFVLNVGN